MGADGGIAGVPAARHLIVLALDDVLCLWEGIVVAGMVDVEVSADEEVDICRTQSQGREVLDHDPLVFRSRDPGRRPVVSRLTAVDENVLSVIGLDEIADDRSAQHSTIR